MREYAKVAPTFWTGATGRALRRRGSEAVLVALYLVSSPHSNMLGLYYQPKMYMAHETGLGPEGASKGLADCIACGFCAYDDDTEMVWVTEMAAWQVSDSLSEVDKRCKGIQKDYDNLPDNPFLGAWFDRYAKAFHLKERRSCEGDQQEVDQGASQDPSKPHRSQEQEQEQELFGAYAPPAAAPPAPTTVRPLDLKERIWAMGFALLGEKGRAFIGKSIATYREVVLLQVLVECTAEQPVDPKAWIVAHCEAAKGKVKPARANGRHAEPLTTLDMLDRDPRPDWVVKAGFKDIFAAESAGCGPGNAHTFREGTRVA